MQTTMAKSPCRNMINLRDEFLDSFIDTEEALKAKLQEVIANKAER
jgi:hypothetical protein